MMDLVTLYADEFLACGSEYEYAVVSENKILEFDMYNTDFKIYPNGMVKVVMGWNYAIEHHVLDTNDEGYYIHEVQIN